MSSNRSARSSCRFRTLRIRALALTLTLGTALAWGSAAPAHAAQPPANPHNEVTLHAVTLPAGITLQYAEKGHGRGQVVIFLHGYTDSWFSWSRVLPLLPSRFHAYAITQRGHGDSDKPATGYAMTDFSEDVVAFMDHFGIREATVVGHSMGSVIAQRLAIDHPDRVSRLVLVGSGADPDQNPVLLDLADFVDTLTDPIDPAFVYDFQASTVYSPVPADFLDTVVAESLKVPARVWQAALHGLVEENTLGELGALAAPTLIFWGDKDDIFPYPDQVELEQGIPRVTLLVYPDTGHGLHWERPERFTEDLVRFLMRR